MIASAELLANTSGGIGERREKWQIEFSPVPSLRRRVSGIKSTIESTRGLGRASGEGGEPSPNQSHISGKINTISFSGSQTPGEFGGPAETETNIPETGRGGASPPGEICEGQSNLNAPARVTRPNLRGPPPSWHRRRENGSPCYGTDIFFGDNAGTFARAEMSARSCFASAVADDDREGACGETK